MSMAASKQCSKPELWGGIECTINRVGDSYCDQLQLSGHYDRPGDIALFAELGITALRYPILWERHEPTKGQPIDWSWTEDQLARLRASGITVIAGLLHHGSGPRFTDLLDPQFASHFASYALAVAEKFPWITSYTPINEPLTTARFSGLYGFWHPHRKDDTAFVRMLVNQVKGIVLAMRAIRTINPMARLVQTEDLGKTHSTPSLAYQADFENERRWLTYDLLCGKVTRTHALWEYLRRNGIDEVSLRFFIENPCVPDVAGMNYYVTSERFLDERITLYPAACIGGNGRHTYADVEAVRVIACNGVETLLREAWQRYGLPLAATEVHMGCTREEQMRWLQETWEACCRMCNSDIDVHAITTWSLLGAFNWNCLLTRDEGYYESGIFDVSRGAIRPTALAAQAASLANVGEYQHPLLNQRGWWHNLHTPAALKHMPGNLKNILMLFLPGTTGHIEEVLEQQCIQRNIPYVIVTGSEPGNVSDHDLIMAMHSNQPWGIIEVADAPDIDSANADASVLAESFLRFNIPFMSISGNHVVPESLPVLINMSIDLFIDQAWGVWNISEKGAQRMEEDSEGQYLTEGMFNSRL